MGDTVSARKYRVITEWRADDEHVPFTYEVWNGDDVTVHMLMVEVADVKQDGDTHVWHAGAYRIVKGTIDTATGMTNNLKPYKVGKGGTVPWIGEMAWAHAANAFRDEVFAARKLAWS